MDKNSLWGLLVIAIVLFGFSWFSNRQQRQLIEEQRIADSIERVRYPEKYAKEPELSADSLRAVADAPSSRDNSEVLAENLGRSLVESLKGEEKFYTIENDVLRMTVSNRGGAVTNVELKNYKRYGGGELLLFEPGSAKFDMSFFMRRSYNYAQVNPADHYFVSDAPQLMGADATTGPQTLTLRLPVDSAAYLEYRYTVSPGQYMVDFDVRFVGMEQWLANLTDFTFDWNAVSRQNEKGFKNENNYTTIAYHYPGDKGIEQLGYTDADRGGGVRSEEINTRIDWFDFKQQFFSSALIADAGFQNAFLKYSTYQPGSGKIKDFQARVSVPYYPNQSEYDFRFYFGPNKFSILKTYDIGIERIVPLGGWLVRWVNRFLVIPVFDFLGKYIANYGIIILLLTIIIKLIISPLTYKSYLSSAKMRVLKPELDEINQQYPKKEDAMKKQQAVMALYKRAGVNPMGGCLPLLIQFPILIAMFRFFPASIELRGEHFLWADDLSSYDSVLNLPFNIPWYGDHVSLFALLMAVALFVYSKINYAQMSSAGPQMAGMKFMTLYLMPVMMLFWFNSYASGLCYYYLHFNLFTIGQTTGCRYIVNEDKLHARLQENAKKPRKKSRWQERYEQAMRQQQQMQRAQQAKNQGGVPKQRSKPQQPKKNR